MNYPQGTVPEQIMARGSDYPIRPEWYFNNDSTTIAALTVSHLSYTSRTEHQYQAVKVPKRVFPILPRVKSIFAHFAISPSLWSSHRPTRHSGQDTNRNFAPCRGWLWVSHPFAPAPKYSADP